MEYGMDVRVRYTEVSKKGSIKLHQYLDYFQDCATFHSEDLGYGYEKLLQERHGWFLLAYDIDILRYPRMGERISVITEPYKFHGFYGYRKFVVKDEAGRKIADADSLWIFMDLDKLLPKKVSDEMKKAYIPVELGKKPRVKRKLKEDGDWDFRTTIPIDEFYQDSNGHVNNRFYCIWAEKYQKPDHDVTKIRIDFRKSSLPGDVLSVYTRRDGETLHVKYKNQNDELVALLEILD